MTLLPVAPLREVRAAALVLGCVVLLAARWSNPWRVAIVVAAVASHVASGLRPEGWLTVFALSLAGEVIEGLSYAEHRQRRVLLGAVGVLGCVVAVDALGAVATGRPPVGLLGDTSTTGGYLGMTAPAVALLWAPLAALVPVALWGTDSTAGWLALAAGALTWLAMARRLTWHWAAGVSAACALAVVLADATFAGPLQEKLGVWHHTVTASASAWVLGHGPGSFAALGLSDGPGRAIWQQAHHELIQWAYEIGLVGVVAVIGYGGSLARHLTRTPRGGYAAPVAAMLVAFAVASCGHFVARLAATAAVGIVACGLAEALGREEATA